MKDKERLFYYLKKEKKYLIYIFIFSLIFVIAQLAEPFLLGRAIDTSFNDDKPLFFTYIFIALALIILGTIAGYLFEYLVGLLSQNMIRNMRKDIYNKLNRISLNDFDRRSGGDLLLLEIKDIENIFTALYSVFKSLIQGIFTIIITILMMVLVNWILAIGVILLSPLSVLMSSFIARFTHKHFKKQASIQSDINSYSLETINNIDTIQSLNYEQEAIKEFKNKNDKLLKEGKVALFSSSWVNPSTRLVNNTIYVLIGIGGIIMLSYDTSLAIIYAVMSIGRLSSFLSYTNQYSKPFNEVSGVISEFENGKYSFKRINEFLSYEDDIDLGKDEINNIDNIKFDHLYFSYNKNKKLIEDFSFEIKRNEKIAIVGPTGAGKTTIINLLMRFYDMDKGDILINDKSIKNYSKKSLRNKIGMVLQDTWIFSGTIYDNIKYNSSSSKEEIIEASKKSHADNFISLLPHLYDTYITSKDLSEGQKQMIAISRIMLKDSDLIILDEATSSIDTRNEKLINDAFDKMMENKTSIIIAHRLSTITSADKIIVMNKGKIEEIGNHNELMKKKGLYYSLYSTQFK